MPVEVKKYVEVEVPVEVTKVLKDLGNTRFDERSMCGIMPRIVL